MSGLYTPPQRQETEPPKQEPEPPRQQAARPPESIYTPYAQGAQQPPRSDYVYTSVPAKDPNSPLSTWGYALALFLFGLLAFLFQSLVIHEQRKLLRLFLRFWQTAFMDNVIGCNRNATNRKGGISDSLVKVQYGIQDAL